MRAIGHSQDDVWAYTPRQVAAYLFLADKRQNRERRSRLYLATLAARGEAAQVKRQDKLLEE